MLALLPAPAHAAKAAKTASRVRHPLIPRWLTHLGPLGLFALGVLDSSVIPIPLPGSTDLLLLWLVSHHGDPYLLVASATAGSILGGYTNWISGKRGGEAALKRYGHSPLFQRMEAWAKDHSILSVFIPPLLPPPVPLSMFLIAAGALGVSRKRFLLAYSASRTLRYTLVAWLAVSYGRRIVRLWSGTLDKYSELLIWLFVIALTAAAGYGFWQFRKTAASGSTVEFQGSAK